MKYAIIGGTGVYDFGNIKDEKIIETPYGEALAYIMEYENLEVVFLARHGRGHTYPPHKINYRANIYALKKLGVEYIYTTAAVGSLNKEFSPGDVVIIKDFLDFTKSRISTFYAGGEKGVRHVDMSDPYCKNLRKNFREHSEDILEIKGEAVYVTTEGPRFESSAEINMFKILGGDVVGMTSNPEVVLAKELGMCYSTIGIITNWCTGIEKGKISHNISNIVDSLREDIFKVIFKVFNKSLNKSSCNCKENIVEL